VGVYYDYAMKNSDGMDATFSRCLGEGCATFSGVKRLVIATFSEF
jgi:hypothetical protein